MPGDQTMATTSNPVPERRGSLTGPLILLLLGIIFLIGNLRPDLSLWRLFGRYWPFLLIVWGAARLLEYAVARAGSRPAPRGFGAGEVVLVVLICIAGSGFSAAQRGDWGPWRLGRHSLEMFGESFDFPVETAQPIQPDATVVISNLRGNIRLAGSDSREIRITGRKSITAFDRASAEEAEKQTPLEITQQDGQVYVRTNQDRLSGERRVSENLEISIPKTAALRLENRQGDFDVNGIAGPIDINSGNAGVRISNIAKDVRINVRRSDIVRATLVQGGVEILGRGRDIELENISGPVAIEGDFSGNIRLRALARSVRYRSSMTEMTLERLPGQVEMDLGSLRAAGVVGPFKLSTRSKDVHVDGFRGEIDIVSRRGDIELRTDKLPLADIRAQSQEGNIELAIPADAVFSLEAVTASGKVENRFGEAIEVTESRKAKKRGATASKPGRGAHIRLSSERGNITLQKAGQEQSL
jgi:DUF4097 and DUF4098 domain-containing protein YvlB